VDNLQLIKAYQNTLWRKKDISAIDRYFDIKAEIHSPVETTIGTENMKHVIARWFKGFPHLSVFWEDFIIDQDKIVVRWRARGDHEGEFLGYPASGATVEYQGVTIYQVSNQKINRYWAFVDLATVIKQISEPCHA